MQEEGRTAGHKAPDRRHAGQDREGARKARDMPRLQKGEVVRPDGLRQQGAAETLARETGKTAFTVPRYNGAIAVRGGLCPKTKVSGKNKGVSPNERVPT